MRLLGLQHTIHQTDWVHPMCADPAMAVGRISGIEPRRDRAEDTKARAAMDAAENKGPAVQDRNLFAPDIKSASKVMYFRTFLVS